MKGSVDVSVHFRTELESCLERLRDEAAALLGLTQERDKVLPSTLEDRRMTSLTRQLIEEKKAKEEANKQLRDMQDLLNKYEKELNEVHKELTDTKERMIKEKVAVETEFNEQQTERRIQKLCLLQEKARTLLSEKGDCPPVWLSLIEELCAEGDSLIEEACKARDELKLEFEAADKQLRSTRAFLEEQAVEREQERDEFTKEITQLSEMLRERDRDWTSQKHFATEVEALEQQVKETTDLLKETEEKKIKVEKELKAAVDKIWVLRDIISELEVQVSSRCEREESLKRRLTELETELNTQARGQADMQQELQSLRDCEDQALQQELCTLKNQLSKQGSPVVVRQIKSQLRTMAKSVEKQIKELEAVNIHVSNASLSSPSEDISIREQLEALRCTTPDEKAVCSGSPPSPVAVEEINQLSDKLLRYSRAAENLIKKLRDRDMEIVMIRSQNEELQTERDVLQGQSERQLLQLASLSKKVEELRVRNDREIQANTAPLHQRILELEKQTYELTDQLKDSQRKLTKMKQKLDRSEALVQSQESKISSLSDHQQELVEKLTQDLETMRTEKHQLQAMVEKYRSEGNVSFPQLIEVMLAEKNADIDQLQLRVEELVCQQDHVSSKNQSHQSKSRGHRVSFADDVAHSRLTEGDRARDAAHHDGSSIKAFFSTPLSSIEEGENRFIPRVIGEDISKIPEPPEIGSTSSSSPNRAVQLENVLSQLKSELEQKTQRLLECEAQLQEMPILEEELTKVKEELVKTVEAVSEDKHFYEEQLRTLGQTKQLLAEREAELREVQADLAQKEEDIVRTSADVKALQIIMEGLREKLKEAKTFAENFENISASNSQLEDMRKSNNKYKEECESYKNTIDSLEEQLSKLNKAFINEKAAQQTFQETVDKLESDKQSILSELVLTKSKCKSLQEELEVASSSAKEYGEKIESLRLDLEASVKENKKLSATCLRLKKEMERLSKKQKSEVKNILRKDSEEMLKMKEELESLKSSNSELQTECEKLQQELNEVGNNMELLKEINNKDDKIQQLEGELQELDGNYSSLKSEKLTTEQSLKSEISELKTLINDLNKNSSLETESQGSTQDRDCRENIKRRYEALKRECERQRRARRESEKKCSVLKSELVKEKQFSAVLQNRAGGDKRVPTLQITKANIIDIRSDGVRAASSLDDLTDEVQKELNASAQLDKTLISGLQKKTESADVPRSEGMPPRVDYLTERLAEVETALRVEQVVVSELRARLTEERARFLEERQRAIELKEEVVSLQTLNDQFEDRFTSIAHQLEQQVHEVKELRKMDSANSSSIEKEKLKKLVEENQRRVDELLQERVFNKNQLLYLREELAKLRTEKETDVQTHSHGHGDNHRGTSVERLQQALECRSRELEAEQRKSTVLQSMLDQANQGTEKQYRELEEAVRQAKDLHSKVEDLEKQLCIEVEVRKSLEAKIKVMELAERSRHSRRKTTEEKLKEQLAQREKEKKELERECLNLHLKLKQMNLQLVAQTAESPLSLRLREANMAVERLVGEKEDLISANTLLSVEKEDLQRKVRGKEELIEDLRTRIHALNIKVTDGGLDNLNAMFASERAAWLKEKESLKKALAQTQTLPVNTDSFNGFTNSAHILQRYLRAESHRKALVWQKRYLMVTLRGYQEEEKQTIVALSRFPPAPPPPTAEHRFRVAVNVVRAVSRMQFLVEHRRRAHENTCRLLRRALNNPRSFPHKVENMPELQTLWRRSDIGSSSSSVQPASLSQYLDRFNTIQDRIKSTLSTAS